MCREFRQFLDQLRTKLKILQYFLLADDIIANEKNLYEFERFNFLTIIRTHKLLNQTIWVKLSFSIQCESVEYRYIIHTSGAKGYSFQRDEKTIIEIDIVHGHCCRKKEKLTNEINVPVVFSLKYFFWKNLKFRNWLIFFVCEKWRIFSCLTKLLTDEIF